MMFLDLRGINAYRHTCLLRSDYDLLRTPLRIVLVEVFLYNKYEIIFGHIISVRAEP